MAAQSTLSDAVGLIHGQTEITRPNRVIEEGTDLSVHLDGQNSRLIEAVLGNEPESVEALIRGGADVNAENNDGTNMSPLNVASDKGFTNIVRILLDSNANVESPDHLDRTPLFNAASSGHHDIVELLLGKGAQIETRDNAGNTALWIAAAHGHIEVIDTLIAKRADVDAMNYSRHSPLYAAIVNKHADAAVTLIRNGADNRITGIYRESLLAFTTDVFKGHEEEILSLVWHFRTYGTFDIEREVGLFPLVATFLMHILSLDSSDEVCGFNWVNFILPVFSLELDPVTRNLVLSTIFKWMNECGEVDAMIDRSHMQAKQVRSFDTDSLADAGGYSGLTLDLVRLVIDVTDLVVALHRANSGDFSALPDCLCNRPVHLTSRLESMRSLLENGDDVEAENIEGLRPIYSAARKGRVELVELLIQRGANVDAADVYGNRPLHEAVSHGLNVVQLLIQHGAQLNVQNADGKTPLHIAIERNRFDVTEYLLSKDADVGLTDVWRNTPLHYVTSRLSGECMERLVNNKDERLLIRNAVGLSALQYIAQYVTPVHSSVRMLLRDCHGNTPLHRAVGVYGMQMFKSSTDVAQFVNFLMKRGASINVPNNDGLTPLHVARGERVIQACIEHADEQSFRITDRRRRNFLHLLFLQRTEHEVERLSSNVDIRHNIVAWYAGYNSVDDSNRNPLHYACMHTDGKAECSQLTKEFVDQLDDDGINKQDTYGRTPLHYAAIAGNQRLMDLLETKTADHTIGDNWEMTATDYVTKRREFNTEMSRLRLQSFKYITIHVKSVTSCVEQYFLDSRMPPCTDELREIVRELRGFDATTYLSKIYDGCRIGYLQQSRATTVFEEINNRVKTAMEYLAEEISAQDTRFACEVVAVGSADDGTKIGCCDEFDYNFVLTRLSETCKVHYSPESPPGFVLLKASTPEYDEDLFNSSGILDTRAVKIKFEALVKQIVTSLAFSKETGFEVINAIQDVFSARGTVPIKPNTCIKLSFTKPLSSAANNYHVPHNVSVDIVPALQIADWWPEDARRKETCQTGKCLIVFTQPQSKYPWIGWTQPHGFISFAQTESRLLQERPPVVKDAYVIVKRLCKYFCHCKLFPSYVAKTALLWCLEEEDFSNGSPPNLLRLVQSTLRRLLCFAAQDYVPSYFMPKCHQTVWRRERYVKQFHERLYQHGLTYTDLFSLNEQQSQDSLLQDIKSIFLFSHLMYWSMLSDTDELEQFIPSTINPLCDTPYTPISAIKKLCYCRWIA